MKDPRTIEEHLSQNAEAIEAEAILYARAYGISLADARREVEDEYRQGWHDDIGWIGEARRCQR